MTLEKQLEELENKVTISIWMGLIPWYYIYTGFLWFNDLNSDSISVKVNSLILIIIQWVFIILALAYIIKRKNVRKEILIREWTAVLKLLEKEVDKKEKTDKV